MIKKLTRLILKIMVKYHNKPIDLNCHVNNLIILVVTDEQEVCLSLSQVEEVQVDQIKV